MLDVIITGSVVTVLVHMLLYDCSSTCSPPGDSADLDANKNTASLFSENCPLKLVRSFEVNFEIFFYYCQ